ncbi:hypothetical protein V2H45_15230 [Tumidithrix elongata RA019]|uniref:Uncharacterized protein n=1 Tax=Tumidithrix elongata BACA0141 TaxID=2716417 RepID=A0AAW9PZ14_9CYAN|nr:hypothetical protein [Tumidithrix elongata RA019]
MKIVDEMLKSIPQDLPEGLREVRIDHVYNSVLLKFCELLGIKTLGQILSSGQGHMFCSTETFLPCPEVYDAERVFSQVQPAGETSFSVRIEYSTKHIRSDTLRMELHQGALLSIVAMFVRKDGDCLVFRPLVMGAPWLHSQDPAWIDKVMWWNQDFYENFIEDFDEFARIREVPKPDSIDIMRHVPERGFKMSLARILGDRITKDWGGEQSDHYTSNIHLNGRRTTAAFLLKGPAKFSPMTLNHLGKNNDQIYRLAQEPSEVLFIQHSHDITPPVRATLRAFAVQPGKPRRYCLIDGRDSLWLLNAYGLLDDAMTTV